MSCILRTQCSSLSIYFFCRSATICYRVSPLLVAFLVKQLGRCWATTVTGYRMTLYVQPRGKIPSAILYFIFWAVVIWKRSLQSTLRFFHDFFLSQWLWWPNNLHSDNALETDGVRSKKLSVSQGNHGNKLFHWAVRSVNHSHAKFQLSSTSNF